MPMDEMPYDKRYFLVIKVQLEFNSKRQQGQWGFDLVEIK